MPTTAAPTTAASPSAATGCVTKSIDYAPGATGKTGEPATLAAAALQGLQPSDQFAASNGGAAEKTVRVLRAGVQIGELHFVRASDGTWLVDVAVLCSGLGLR